MNQHKTQNKQVWQSVKQALVILQQLQKGPANKSQLMQAVKDKFPDAYNQPTEKAQERSFERTLSNLRHRLHAKIEWDPSLRAYYLVDSGPFIKYDLPEDVLTSIAFLLETFGPESGAYEILQPLLNLLEKTLTSEQLRHLEKQNAPLRVNLSRLDGGVIPPDVWEKVRYAVKQRRVIEFDYLSPRHDYPEPRRHKVEPYEIRFERGHYYLRGYCLRWRNPQGYEGGNHRFSYRLDHILSQNFRLTSETMRVGQRRQRLILIRYRAAPRLWRGGLTQHFEEMVAGEPDDAGWVEIQAKAEDLFQAHRILLAYGELCQALGPPELVRMMETAVAGMLQLYQK